jgi:hypothetical protein
MNLGHANRSIGQVGKVLGDKWKALSEKQREPYEKKAATDKKRYEDEKAKYNVSPVGISMREHTLTTSRLRTKTTMTSKWAPARAYPFNVLFSLM